MQISASWQSTCPLHANWSKNGTVEDTASLQSSQLVRTSWSALILVLALALILVLVSYIWACTCFCTCTVYVYVYVYALRSHAMRTTDDSRTLRHLARTAVRNAVIYY